MGTLTEIARLVASLWTEWQQVTVADLRFLRADTARLSLVALIGLAVAMLALRSTIRRRSGEQRVALPAILASLQPTSLAFVRHVPLLLVMAGLPWLVLALADPYSVLRQRQETFPGRRICLMIDASSSMVRPFTAPTLRAGTGSQASFFTTVKAAERFVELRTQGRYKDLMALVEFGDQAYVITPFTTDYDNIKLSLSLIGDFSEFIRFPDQGTLLGNAVRQGVRLFEAFDYLEASGNLMVLFSDGEDSSVIASGTPVADIVREAVRAEVPVYFVRTRYGREFGTLVSDAEWKAAVEETGGRFYAASDETAILQAIRDIDRLGTGRIDLTQYVRQEPMYAPFALIAAALWSLAVALAMTVPAFRRFP
ncbi:MAG TPA: vWA domain-containing protein [Vicinamibacterales bacterium]